MKRPATKTLVVGHPVVAVPLSLASGVSLYAGFQTGSTLGVVVGIALIAAVRGASQQASAYRAWQAEWQAMSDGHAPSSVTLGRIVGTMAVAALALVAYGQPLLLAHATGYAVGWIGAQRWLLASLGLLALGVLVQFIRCLPRRDKPTRPVTVVAQTMLPLPSIGDAYRALPPYCHALLRGQS